MSDTSRANVGRLMGRLAGLVENDIRNRSGDDLLETAEVLDALVEERDKVQDELEKLQGDYRALLFKYSSITLD